MPGKPHGTKKGAQRPLSWAPATPTVADASSTAPGRAEQAAGRVQLLVGGRSPAVHPAQAGQELRLAHGSHHYHAAHTSLLGEAAQSNWLFYGSSQEPDHAWHLVTREQLLLAPQHQHKGESANVSLEDALPAASRSQTAQLGLSC